MDDIGSLPVKRLPSPQLAQVRRRHVEVFLFTTRAEYIASQSGPRRLFSLEEIIFIWCEMELQERRIE